MLVINLLEHWRQTRGIIQQRKYSSSCCCSASTPRHITPSCLSAVCFYFSDLCFYFCLINTVNYCASLLFVYFFYLFSPLSVHYDSFFFISTLLFLSHPLYSINVLHFYLPFYISSLSIVWIHFFFLILFFSHDESICFALVFPCEFHLCCLVVFKKYCLFF